MDDEFEVELRIAQLEKAYSIASTALQRARITLEAARSHPTSSAAQIERAQKRCEELTRRKDSLRFTLDRLEDSSGATQLTSRRERVENPPNQPRE